MDDDLMSLRGSTNRPDDDDDLFGSFTDPDDLGFDLGPAPPAPSRSSSMDVFDDSPFDFNVFDEPAVAPAPPPATSARAPVKAPAPSRTKARRTRARSGGLKPQERMVLSIFLFLLVAEYGLFILLIIGAIRI